jgi:hypothetical protein
VTVKRITDVNCYDTVDQFKTTGATGAGKAFGSINRFGYYNTSVEKNGKKPLPSGSDYQLPGQFGNDVKDSNVKFGPNKVYSFGVSRNSMNTMHIDDIQK